MRNNEDRFGVSPQQQDPMSPQQFAQQHADQIAQSSQPQLSFIVPTEFVDLPSKGNFYPTGHPLFCKDVIEIKQMTAKEEDILTSKNLLKKGVALDKLIQSLILDRTINADTLTVEDRNAILVAARISAYGADYNTTMVCPSCNEKVKSSFNLAEAVEETEKKEVPPVNSSGHFEITLPKTKWAVRCRALTGHDEKTLLKISESKKTSNSGDSLLLEQLKLLVVAIEQVTDRSILESALSALPASDAKYIRTQYRELVPNINMTHSFTCTSCQHSADVEVPLNADFFWFK